MLPNVLMQKSLVDINNFHGRQVIQRMILRLENKFYADNAE